MTRTALVTGGASGIGAAICRRFAKEGMTVVVADINTSGAETIASEVGGAAHAVDVSDSASVDRLFEAVVAEQGSVDVLVTNAGPFAVPVSPTAAVARAEARAAGKPQPSLEATRALSDEDWDRMIGVHLYGTFYCTRAALRHMEAQGSGVIINVASTAGVVGFPGAPHYSAAKSAIIGFTRSVAVEVAGSGIRMNAIAPGFIDTPLLDAAGPGLKAYAAMATPLGRCGTAEEIAAAAAFLASDENQFMIGTTIQLDGGADPR